MDKKVIIGGSLGTLMEWYDYTIYGFLALPISTLFFPHENKWAALLYTYAIFAIGYFARPLGGFFLGFLGDTYGRKWVLILAISLMGLSTTLLGIIPTYQQIGGSAPILLLCFRVLQGFAVGGEYMNAAIFLVEQAPAGKRGFFGSMNNVGGAIGCLLGSIFVTALTFGLAKESFMKWGWRIPFLLGTLTAILGIWVRLKLTETRTFISLQKQNLVEFHPISFAFKKQFKEMGWSFILVLSQSVSFYLATFFFLTWAVTEAKFSYKEALISTTCALVVVVFVTVISGSLSDRFGRKRILAIALLGFVLFSLPLFAWILHAPVLLYKLILGQAVLACLASLYNGTLPATLVELFHAQSRCSALTISYNLAAGILGGSTLFFSTYLIKVTKLALSPTFLLIGVTLLSFIFLLQMPETAKKPLKFVDDKDGNK